MLSAMRAFHWLEGIKHRIQAVIRARWKNCGCFDGRAKEMWDSRRLAGSHP